MKRIALGAAFVLSLFASGALAQSKLGEVLDQGGKVLSGDELKALLSGSTVSGPRGSGEFRMQYKTDGTISGTVSGFQGSAGAFGKWKVDEKGRLCADVQFSVSTIPSTSGCGFYFKVGDCYFGSLSESDQNAGVALRTVTR